MILEMMVVDDTIERNLTYCLNVHPGERLRDVYEAIERFTLDVKRRVCPDRPFGLGLRLGAAATSELAGEESLAEFRCFLDAHNLFVPTINGFPYSTFHGTRVKQHVYAPDWRHRLRLDYTLQLADILASLLPEGRAGSISTVPGSYGYWIEQEGGLDFIVKNLSKCADYLYRLEDKTGKRVMLALEPEPDCLLDDVENTLCFFNEVLAESRLMRKLSFDWRRYITLCLDTCHFSVVFDDPLESLQRFVSSGIEIGKVQLSAALCAASGKEVAAQLRDFEEATYLHQVRIRNADGVVNGYPDLEGHALEMIASDVGSEVRVHMHVPLYFEKSGGLQSTSCDLSEAFFKALAQADIPQLEIETYTFGVLPDDLSSLSVVESIVKEFEWCRHRMAARH